MYVEPLGHLPSQHRHDQLKASVSALFLLMLVPLLASCGAPAPLEFVPVDLGIPAQALSSPVVGPLPDSTKLHVGITFKVDQDIINKPLLLSPDWMITVRRPGMH